MSILGLDIATCSASRVPVYSRTSRINRVSSFQIRARLSALNNPKSDRFSGLHRFSRGSKLYVESPVNSENIVPPVNEPSPGVNEDIRESSSLLAESNGNNFENDAILKSEKSTDNNGSSSNFVGEEINGSAGALPNTVSEEGKVSTDGGWQKRWTIVALCFFAFLLCNMDRVNMSIAILPMQDQYKWSPSTVGLVQSSFFWGYLLTQIVGGLLSDTVGGKPVLGFGVIWWSIATVLTPFAANLGLPALLIARACMGIGEGVAMPAMNNLLSRWVPVTERSRSLSLVYSGMYLGSVTGLALSPSIIQTYGWSAVFEGFGALGVVWFALWQFKAYSTPEEDPTVSPAERQLIKSSTFAFQSAPSSSGGGHFAPESTQKLASIPWKLILSKPAVWAIIICHFCHNWGTFILLTWMPTYYRDVLGFNLSESGLFSVLPWLTMAVSANVGGWLADSMIAKGYSVTLVRKVMQTIGFLGPALCLSQLTNVTSPPLAVLCMMASQGCDAFSQSGLYSNHQDIGPRYAGVLLGISNTAGVLAGVFGTALTGQILQNGSWNDVFKVAVVLYLIGTLVWNIWATGEQVLD